MQCLRRIVVMGILLCLLGPASLAAEQIERTTEGFGPSREEAVVEALLEAVQQVKGMSLSGTERMRSSFLESFSSQNGEQSSQTQMSQAQQADIQKTTQGIIQSYEVLQAHRIQDRPGWKARVRVQIPEYETPGLSPDNRRKLAVIPFQSPQQRFAQPQGQVSAEEISRNLAQKLVTELTQARRFTVVDREYVRQYQQEKQLLLSGDAPVEEEMRLGEVLGVDYLLLGTIADYRIAREPYTIEVSGETGYDIQADFQVDYRILVMATRQIKWSDSVHVHLSEAELQNLQRPSVPFVHDALVTRAAQDIARSSLGNIYPIRIVQVDAQRVVLNQGGVTLEPGYVCDVYRPGDKVTDPYSGESLGRTENWAGQIEIQRVTAKKSYAELVQGSAEDIQKGYICRRVGPEEKMDPQGQGETTDVQSTSDGGVVLPFD